MFQQRWQKAVFLNFLSQPHLHIIYIYKTFKKIFRYNNINESLISEWNIHMYCKQQSKEKLRIQVKKMKYQMKRRLSLTWHCWVSYTVFGTVPWIPGNLDSFFPLKFLILEWPIWLLLVLDLFFLFLLVF